MALTGKEDHFRGLTIDSTSCSPEQLANFKDTLLQSENEWKAGGKRCIWFNVNNQQCHLIPILIDHGYDFHHAKPGSAMLKKWLPDNETDNVPHYPFTFIGVGGLVIKDNQVLLVKERFALTGKWKLPGGHVDSGEDFGVAAAREVKEETGLITRDLGIVTFRHTHPHPELNFPSHQCSDIYIIVLLEATGGEVVKQEAEIAEAKWHDIDKILASDDIHEHNKEYIRQGIKHSRSGTGIKLNKETIQFGSVARTMSVYRIES